MEAVSFPYENCSGNLSTKQLTKLSLTRNIVAAVCCIILFTVLAIVTVLAKLYYQRVCGTVIKRLVIGLTAAAIPYQLFIALDFVYYFYPHDVKFCEAVGFLTQYFGSVWLLFILGISLVLFFRAWELANCWKPTFIDPALKEQTRKSTSKINKLEIALLISILVLPLLFDWIPFVTNSYGPEKGSLCWIHKIKRDCSTQTAGLVEKIALWDVPFGLVAVLTLILFVATLCLLKRELKNTKVRKLIELGFVGSLISLAFLAFTSIMSTVVNYYLQHHFVLWLYYALYLPDPLSGTLIPIALLFGLHFPLTSAIVCVCCKHKSPSQHVYRVRQSEEATVHRSSNWTLINQPSRTTWNPSHEDTESTPFVIDKQRQDYEAMLTGE